MLLSFSDLHKFIQNAPNSHTTEGLLLFLPKGLPRTFSKQPRFDGLGLPLCPDFTKAFFLLLFINFLGLQYVQNCHLTLQFSPNFEIGLFGGGKVHRDDSFTMLLATYSLSAAQIYFRAHFYRCLGSTMSKYVKKTAQNKFYCCQHSECMPLKAANSTQNCCRRLLRGLKVPRKFGAGYAQKTLIQASRLFTTGLLSKTSQDASSQLA